MDILYHWLVNLYFDTGILGFLYSHNLIGQNAFYPLYSSPPPTDYIFLRGSVKTRSQKLIRKKKTLTES